jgi:hypothetical protein
MSKNNYMELNKIIQTKHVYQALKTIIPKTSQIWI